jgi:hypothetical protein
MGFAISLGSRVLLDLVDLILLENVVGNLAREADVRMIAQQCPGRVGLWLTVNDADVHKCSYRSYE